MKRVRCRRREKGLPKAAVSDSGMAVRTGEERRRDTIVTLGLVERTENGEAFKGVIRRRRLDECAGKKENENEWIMGIE